MYSVDARLAVETLAVSRRTFLKCCSVLTLCFPACRTFFPRTRFARLVLNDPHPDDYDPILRGLIQAILPFEHPQFPGITPDIIRSRLLSLFPIGEEERFLDLERSLMFFNACDLFPHMFAPIVEDEEDELADNDGLKRSNIDQLISDKRLKDEQLYEQFVRLSDPLPTAFTELSLEPKRAYLRIWGQSGFVTKRQLYRSVKALVMITAYSTDELWKAIGYEGPLLKTSDLKNE